MATIICGALSLAAAPAEPADTVVMVKAGAPWSVTGGDDCATLKRLAAGVGWEFAPNPETTAGLKELGIKRIRCINVDPLPGAFDDKGAFVIQGKPSRLDAHLETCRQIGASPHICFGIGTPPGLEVSTEDVKKELAIMGQQPGSYSFWNGDWNRFKAHCKAYFDYVIVKGNFPEARFEVGNEPDIDGQFPRRPGAKVAMGSAKLYEAYFDVYRHAAEAAAEFQKERGVKVAIGGPALAWAFTFKFGDFNWAERFIRDCAAEKLKLDFIGVHFYGNIASLDGRYKATYPSFTEMLRVTKSARDAACPGTPILITEWGPSYITNNSEASAVNANHIGAAWTAAFLNTLLQNGIEEALYLVTTDLAQPRKEDGKLENIWGWPSLFVNPTVFGKAYPKAPFQVLSMISKLEGGRVEATAGGPIRSFCVADKAPKRIQCLLWQYDVRIPENGAPVDMGVRQAATVRIRDGAAFLGTPKAKITRWLVSETVGDAHSRFKAEGKIDDRCRQTLVDSAVVSVIDGELDYGFAMPPSSVSLLEIVPANDGE